MKWLFVILLIIIMTVIGFFYFIFFRSSIFNTGINPGTTSSPTATTKPKTSTNPTTSPTPQAISYCEPQDLKATITLSPGAGNTYGTTEIKNTSNNQCVINSGYVQVQYDMGTINNIKIVKEGQVQEQPFVVNPN